MADFGSGPGGLSTEIARKAKSLLLVDMFAPSATLPGNTEVCCRDLNDRSDPLPLHGMDQVLLLDIIEHLLAPEEFLDWIRGSVGPRCEIIISTPNIAFLPQRLLLLLGHFSYGRKGILDRTHTRLFTESSLRRALTQAGFEVLRSIGIPAPFPEILGKNTLSALLLRLNRLLLALSSRLFAFQIVAIARPIPRLADLPVTPPVAKP